MNHISKNELELVEYVRLAINDDFGTNFSNVAARKIYELIKIITNSEPKKFICRTCRKKHKFYDVE